MNPTPTPPQTPRIKTSHTALTALAVVALALMTGCGSSDSEQQTAESADPRQQIDQLLLPDARNDQQAAAAGAATAMELGFGQAQLASDEEIQAVRETAQQRTETAQDLNVTPPECATAIGELDWSPMLADTEHVTRIDFSTETFQGIGSIEIAAIDEDAGGSPQAAEQVTAHTKAVENITGPCSDLTMMLADASEPDWAELEYTFTAEPIELDAGNGLRWERYPTDTPETNNSTALSVMTQYEGYAIMVAFAGSPEIMDQEFVDITETILEAAIAQLG